MYVLVVAYREVVPKRTICQLVAYGRLKTKEFFTILVLQVVAVVYER